MAFPSLFDVVISVVILVIGVPVVYLLSRALRLRPKPIAIAEPRREATLAVLVVMAVFVAISVLRAFWQTVATPTLQLEKLPPFNEFEVLRAVLFLAVTLMPVIIAMRRTGQNLGSVGISGKRIGQMLALGFILSAIYLTVEGFFARSSGGGFAGFSVPLIYGFIEFAIAGFNEEIVWRGYIQTRLVAYSGTLKGLMATSLIFALGHFPISYFQVSGVVLEALASALLRFFPGLLLGYIMSRSQNIVPSSIFHLFYNWNSALWRIPS